MNILASILCALSFSFSAWAADFYVGQQVILNSQYFGVISEIHSNGDVTFKMKSGASIKTNIKEIKDYSLLNNSKDFYLGQQVIESPQSFGELSEIRSNGDVTFKMKSGTSIKTNINKIQDYSLLLGLKGYSIGQQVIESPQYFGELAEIRSNGDITLNMKSGASIKSNINKIQDYSLLNNSKDFYLGQQVIENAQYFGEITEIRSNKDVTIKMKSGASFRTNINKIKDYSLLNALNNFYL